MILAILTRLTTETVRIPAASISRWISPTDRWQVYQPGVRTAMSTFSALRIRAASGADSLISGVTSGM